MQLSPHFLFNSLGSLETLIEEDPPTARQFVSEMSSVYRYLLQANEHQLTSLRNEINFIKAYTGMLKIRFGEGLSVVMNIEETMMDRLIPPLTLQILLENAVKHNAALKSRPLLVNISTGYGKLVVENNLQKKTSSVSSNKKGLSNIISKYKLLEQPEIAIRETATHFKVIIPLIKKKNYESADSRR
jgi:LytS/YehU family sensor histidine kinase